MAIGSKWVVLGKVLREWGVRGQVRCLSFNPESPLFSQVQEIFIGQTGSYRPIKIEEAKIHGKYWLIHFEGYKDPETVRELRGMELALPREKLPELESGEIYLTDFEGLKVIGPDEKELGVLMGFHRVGESNVMRISQKPKGEIWVPFEDQFVQSTSLDEGRVVLTKAALEFFEIDQNDTSV